MLDRDKLAKVLAMTTSDTDPEALAAIRMANRMLAAAGLTWEAVLAAGGVRQLTVTVTRHGEAPAPYQTQEDWVAPHLKDKVTITLMFRAVFMTPRTGNEGFWEFMDSIHQWFVEHGTLTQKQYQALRAAYMRTVRRA